MMSTTLLHLGSAAAARLKISALSGPQLFSCQTTRAAGAWWRVDVRGFDVTGFYWEIHGVRDVNQQRYTEW